jgi:hypothetical protein
MEPVHASNISHHRLLLVVGLDAFPLGTGGWFSSTPVRLPLSGSQHFKAKSLPFAFHGKHQRKRVGSHSLVHHQQASSGAWLA